MVCLPSCVQEEKELKKAEEKRLKAEAAEAERAEKRKHEEAKLGKVSLLKFFKVAETAPALDAKVHHTKMLKRSCSRRFYRRSS